MPKKGKPGNTKQGVLDLNGVGPKLKPPRTDEPPKGLLCKHRNTRRTAAGYLLECKDCGASRDYYGDSWESS